MKTIYWLLFFVCTSLSAMQNKNQAIIEQAKEDAVVIKALCYEHAIDLPKSFNGDDLKVNNLEIECWNKKTLFSIFGKINILHKNCAKYFINRATKKSGCFTWRVNYFKQLLLKFFDQTKFSLRKRIQQVKQELLQSSEQ